MDELLHCVTCVFQVHKMKQDFSVPAIQQCSRPCAEDVLQSAQSSKVLTGLLR